MTGHTDADGGDRGTERASDEQTGAGADGRSWGTSRRTFLKATAAGTLAGGFAAGTFGSASAEGIPTPWLSRSGSDIVDETGSEVVLRGVNIADPKRINTTASARGKTAEQVIDYATDATKGWHSRVIRLPIHPGDIAELPPIPISDEKVHMPPTFSKSQLETYCDEHLDPVVDKCEEEGVYCIVDYHRHWGSSQLHWDNDALAEEVQMFWNTVAPKYADRSHVVYEMYNEPTKPGIFADPTQRQYEADRWRKWQSTAQPWVDTIRSHADNLVIVGSPSWSQSPEGALVKEFEGGDLCYAYHIYPGHSISDSQDWDTNNDNGQGVSQAYEEVPLFATEFGWQTGIAAYPTIGNTEDFGKPFIDWMESNNISWTAWCFDPTWLSSMVKRSFEAGGAQDAIGDPYSGSIPTYCESLPCEWEPRTGDDMGGYVKQVLADKKDAMVPGGETDPGPTEPPTTEPPTTQPPNPGETPPAWPDGTQPTDPNDDGVFENLNGNERIDSDDVVVYFENYDEPHMADNAGFYDLNDNGRTDSDDVVVLFESL